MRHLTILSIIIAFSVSCNVRNNNETDLAKENLKGDVQGFIQVEYTAVEKFGEPEKDILVEDLLNLNSVNTYNTKGNLTETWKLLGVNKVVSYKYYYNDLDNLDFIDYFDSNDNLNLRSKFTYDSEGRIEVNTKYNGEGDLAFSLEYIYNKKDQLVKIAPIYPNIVQGRFHDTITYEYPGDGIKIIRHVNSLSKTNNYEKYRFGKKISSETGNDYREFTYNENGDIASEKIVDSTSTMLIYNYKYDSIGNWTELVKYKKSDIPNNDKMHPLSIICRTITYRIPRVEKTAGYLHAESSYLKEYQADERRRIQHCNESAVRNRVVNRFEETTPDWKVILSSMSIIPLKDCRYKINLVLEYKEYTNLKKDIEFVFTYTSDYKDFTFSEWRESWL